MEPLRATRVGLGVTVLAVGLVLGLAACGDDDSASDKWPTGPGSAAASAGTDQYSELSDQHIAAYLRGVDVIGDKYGIPETGNSLQERAENSANMRESLCAPDGDGGWKPSIEGRYATGVIIEAGAEEMGVPSDVVPNFSKEMLDLGENTLCVPN
ncbi:MAG: hypothetical protein HOV68_22455 [Streptomycetaceae bacterium]|nr:hypothetical protein [Streptomycetaceae bacterium]